MPCCQAAASLPHALVYYHPLPASAGNTSGTKVFSVAWGCGITHLCRLLLIIINFSILSAFQISSKASDVVTWYEKIRADSKIAAYLDWLCIHATPAARAKPVTSQNTKLCTLSLGQSPMKMLYFTETSFLGRLGTLQRCKYGPMSPQSPHFAMYLQGCWLIADGLSFGMDQLFHRDHSQSVSPGTWKFGEKRSFL